MVQPETYTQNNYNIIEKEDQQRKKFENESDQYSRANAIKIQGIHHTNPRKSARESANFFSKYLKITSSAM